MTRSIALPLLAAGVALLALAVTILPFESALTGLAEKGPMARLQALQSAALAALLLSLLAATACWWRPRHVLAMLLLALALGTAGGTATLVVVPELVDANPIQVAAQRP